MREAQEFQILRDLEKGKVITPIDALRDYQCFRLAARIKDLRDEGYKIKTEMMQKNGKRYAMYYL